VRQARARPSIYVRPARDTGTQLDLTCADVRRHMRTIEDCNNESADVPNRMPMSNQFTCHFGCYDTVSRETGIRAIEPRQGYSGCCTREGGQFGALRSSKPRRVVRRRTESTDYPQLGSIDPIRVNRAYYVQGGVHLTGGYVALWLQPFCAVMGLVIVGLAFAVYRSWHFSWGTTNEDRIRRLP
jgi:hypothetical protein